MQFAQGLRAAKLAVALTAALAITGCAKNAADEAAGGANQYWRRLWTRRGQHPRQRAGFRG